MTRISRRSMIRRAALEAAASSLAAYPALSRAGEIQTTQSKGRIRQSVSRWCYEKIPPEELCAKGARMGLKAIDLLNEDEWELPRRYGLVCSMGYSGGGEIRRGMNRVKNHAKI
jgi:hydroxypyruvate isomerase